MFIGNFSQKLTLLCILSVLTFTVRAQYTPFAYTYGGLDTETGYGIVEAPDSGYVCTGQSGSFSFGSSDVYLFKTDKNGQLLWQTHIGGWGVDGGRAVVRGHGGGYLIAGYTNSWGNGGYDYFVVRTDSLGDTLWTRTYGGSDWDFAYSACPTADGGYLIAGETYSLGNGGADIWVLKIDDNGDTVRTFLWGDTGNQTCAQIKEYQPGKAVVVGNGQFPLSDGHDAVLLGIDHQTGNYDFETIVPYPGDQEMTSVDMSVAGGFVTFGIHVEEGHSKDLLVQTYTLAGSHLQNAEIAGNNEQYDLEIHTGFRRGNRYYVSGSSLAIGSIDYEALFFELDPFPYVSFGRVITAPRYNALQHMIRASDNGIVMVGIAEGFGPGPSGALVWKLDSAMQTGPYPVPMMGVEDVQEVVGFTVYPNPFVESLYLSIPESMHLSEVRIWDLNGRLVHRTGLQGVQGNTQVFAGQLPQGMYTAEFVSDSGKRYYAKLVKTP